MIAKMNLVRRIYLLSLLLLFNLMLNITFNTDILNASENLANKTIETNYVEAEVISPLVTITDKHAQIYTTTFDKQHLLYPIKIISIDGWKVADSIFDSDLMLSEGLHTFRIEPDFSNIEEKLAFMLGQLGQKDIELKLNDQQHIAFGARIKDADIKGAISMDWKPEIYLLDKKNNK